MQPDLHRYGHHAVPGSDRYGEYQVITLQYVSWLKKKIIDTIKVKAGLSCVNLLQNTFTNNVLSQCSISSQIQLEDARFQVMSEFQEMR